MQTHILTLYTPWPPGLGLKVKYRNCAFKDVYIDFSMFTQVNRMSKSRRVLATGGKQRSFGQHMVCFVMVLYHNEPHEGIKSTYKP